MHRLILLFILFNSASVVASHSDSIAVSKFSTAAICEHYDGSSLDLINTRLIREEGIQLNYDGYNNLEGPVWYEGALYYSNIGNKTEQKTGQSLNNQTTIWRWEPGTEATIWMTDSLAGTNGMAISPTGDLIVARHLDGSISKIDWVDKSITPVINTYDKQRFNSPNDLVIASDGSIYFTDPDWNVPNTVDMSTIQGGEQQHIYRISTDGIVSKTNVTSLVQQLGNKPNGITLSLDETQLLVAGLEGLWSFTITDNDLTEPKQHITTPIDGLGRDCAGNIYITTTRKSPDNRSYQAVVVLDSEYEELGEIVIPDIQIVTNVAFGGDDRKTLYITSLTVPDNNSGSGPRYCGDEPCKPAGIYSVQLTVPGFPY